MANSAKLHHDERRRYFRINDDINLYYTILNEASSIKNSYLSNNILESCSLSTALELMTQEANTVMHRIELREPEIAKYLAILNSKIDLIAQAINHHETETSDYQTRNVNLSASGVAFEGDELLNVGTVLELKMVLSSLTAVVVTHAKVVYCKQNPEHSHDSHPFLIAVDFVNLQESERELINSHIIRKQIQQIREHKVDH